MKHGPTRRGVLAGAAGLIALPHPACAMAPGSGRIEVAEAGGATPDPMPVWYHRPAAWAPALLILGACTGSSPAPQTEADPVAKTPSSAPLSPWPARTLLLRSPGEAPLSPLRVAVGEAALELRFSSEALVLGELGGAPVDQVRLRSSRTVAVRAKPVDGENSFDYTILSYHDEAGLPEAEQAAIDAALQGLVGAWRSDGRCAVSGAGVAPVEELLSELLVGEEVGGEVDAYPERLSVRSEGP